MNFSKLVNVQPFVQTEESIYLDEINNLKSFIKNINNIYSNKHYICKTKKNQIIFMSQEQAARIKQKSWLWMDDKEIYPENISKNFSYIHSQTLKNKKGFSINIFSYDSIQSIEITEHIPIINEKNNLVVGEFINFLPLENKNQVLENRISIYDVYKLTELEIFTLILMNLKFSYNQIYNILYLYHQDEISPSIVKIIIKKVYKKFIVNSFEEFKTKYAIEELIIPAKYLENLNFILKIES